MITTINEYKKYLESVAVTMPMELIVAVLEFYYGESEYEEIYKVIKSVDPKVLKMLHDKTIEYIKDGEFEFDGYLYRGIKLDESFDVKPGFTLQPIGNLESWTLDSATAEGFTQADEYHRLILKQKPENLNILFAIDVIIDNITSEQVKLLDKHSRTIWNGYVSEQEILCKSEPYTFTETNYDTYKKYLKESLNDTHDKFYHGSSKEQLALQILSDGYLKPGNVDIKRGGKLTPKIGMVYLTPKVSEAGIYAIGANILGNNIWPNMIEKDGRYGYLFVIDKSNVIDKNIYADEDYIGQAIHHLATNKFYNEGFGKDVQDFKYTSELLHIAKYNLTPLQYQKVLRYDDYADFAVAGKKLMFKLPKNIHLDLIRLGSPAAVEGQVKISEAWKIDKEKCKDLNKDGSNFFEIAEQVL